MNLPLPSKQADFDAEDEAEAANEPVTEVEVDVEPVTVAEVAASQTEAEVAPETAAERTGTEHKDVQQEQVEEGTHSLG